MTITEVVTDDALGFILVDNNEQCFYVAFIELCHVVYNMIGDTTWFDYALLLHCVIGLCIAFNVS